MRGLALIPVVLLAAVPIPALALDTCDFAAFSTTGTPQEAEVRADPDAAAPVLGTLPEYTLGGQTFRGAEFRVVEMRDGWARITDVRGVDRQRSAGPDGWIDAAQVEFVLRTEVAFAGPDETLAIVAQVRWPFRFRLEDCHQGWAQISFNQLALADPRAAEAGTYKGWVRGICAIPELGTCDGVHGDRLPPDPGATDANP